MTTINLNVFGSSIDVDIENPAVQFELDTTVLDFDLTSVNLDIELESPVLDVGVQTVQLILPVSGTEVTGGLRIIWGETPNGTIDGVNKTYISAYSYSSNQLAVFLNGLRQKRINDYTETGNQSFSFVNAPLPGDSLSIDYVLP